MDIQLAKEDIIKRFQKINDESLILAIKNLLDYAQKVEIDMKLEESLARGLEQSISGEVKSHKEVMDSMRENISK